MRSFFTLKFPAFSAFLLISVTLFSFPPAAEAQQVTNTTTMNNINEGFNEAIGTSWGGRWKGINFSINGGGNQRLGTPQYGGYNPNSGLSWNGAWGDPRNGGDYLQFNGWASQGFNRTYTSEAPSVTMMNGQQGVFSDTTQTPFVMGVIPTVGSYNGANFVGPNNGGPVFFGQPSQGSFSSPRGSAPMGGTPVATQQRGAPVSQLGKFLQQGGAEQLKASLANQQRQQEAQRRSTGSRPAAQSYTPRSGEKASTAMQAVPSVAEARRMFQQEQQAKDTKAMIEIERGKTAEAKGDVKLAAKYYKSAYKLANPTLQGHISKKLLSMGEGTR